MTANDRTPKQRPNILFILADDLGWGDVGFHDSPIKTPHLDALARTGVVLDQHYACPVCTPTRVSLMTGRHPGRFGTHATVPSNAPVLPDGYQTLATVLKSCGYRTGLFGKWHLGSDPAFGPHEYGFDYAYGSLAGGVDPYNHRYKRGPFSFTWHRNGTRVDEPGHVTDLITDEAVRWIETVSGDTNPWFCYVPFTAVHTPVKPPMEWLEPYGDTVFDPDPEKDESYRKYAAYTSHMDHSVGRLIETLQRTDRYEDTLIVFSSDNGSPTRDTEGDVMKYPGYQEDCPRLGSNFPLKGKKTQVYEGGIRTPTIIKWRGRLEPGVRRVPMQITDWMPTLCALAGYSGDPEKHKWDGTNMWPVLSGSRPPDRSREFYWNVRKQRYALRHDGWKVVIPDADTPPELYRIDADPLESRDLSTEYPDILEDLMRRLEAHQATDNTDRRPDAPAE
jgi:arylsulfatase A-like enzyme